MNEICPNCDCHCESDECLCDVTECLFCIELECTQPWREF